MCSSAAFNLWPWCNGFSENSDLRGERPPSPPSTTPCPANVDVRLSHGRPASGIYIIVLPGSPLNRVPKRDSAGASFRADVDGRFDDLANKTIRKNVRRPMRDSSGRFSTLSRFSTFCARSISLFFLNAAFFFATAVRLHSSGGLRWSQVTGKRTRWDCTGRREPGKIFRGAGFCRVLSLRRLTGMFRNYAAGLQETELQD